MEVSRIAVNGECQTETNDIPLNPIPLADSTLARRLTASTADFKRKQRERFAHLTDDQYAAEMESQKRSRSVKDAAANLANAYSRQFGENWAPDTGTLSMHPYDTFLPFEHFAIQYRDGTPHVVDNDFLDEVVLQARGAADRENAIRRQRAMHNLAGQIGRLHANCSLDGFEGATPEHTKVIQRLRAFQADIRKHIVEGHGIVLFGKAGGGKTHLAAAMARAATGADAIVGWTTGPTMAAAFRKTVSDKRISEDDVADDYTTPHVLVIDDLLPPGSAAITDFQAQTLMRVIDERYRALKPTWVTMNVTSGLEADARLGAAILDRLRSNALCLKIGFPSFRKPLESE
jgi:DNA replication protein DnaC